MLASRFFVSTQKEAPSDAEIVSHKLMLRAGMIKRLAAGIYTYLPMGLAIIRKVERIVREEMNRAGAVELLMPIVQPAELWQETGRFEKMGPELLRVRDRHERDNVIQPTSEEVVTDIARQELKSYRSLPRNFYQIQTKFRDERRPRFGIMRGREFTMKDAYSFDRDVAAAGKSYEAMYAAYVRIFERIGLQFRAVAADTGAIGGDRSHEFQVITDTGEDAIAYCPNSDYAANIELAEAVAPSEARKPPAEELHEVATPGKTSCDDVARFLDIPLDRTMRSIVLATDRIADEKSQTQIWLALVRGDHELNETKLGKLDGFKDGWRWATPAEIVRCFGSRAGSIGPVPKRDSAGKSAGGPLGAVQVIADRTAVAMSDFVTGANEDGYHYTGANWGRDVPEPYIVADIRNVVAGDPSPDGKGTLAIQRGIEVGHVFFLGTKYSRAMNATFLDEAGKPQFFEMGCYGIGITRIVGAAIEQNHDERGIIWQRSIAPFEVVVCPIGWGRSAAVREAATKLYDDLIAAGIEVLLDDRDERPGVMFADWELIGVPLRVTVGERGLKEGKVELQPRRTIGAGGATEVNLADAMAAVREELASR